MSARLRERWSSNSMFEASKKATATWKERFLAGKYDFIERNKKISETVSKMYVDGEMQFSTGRYESTKMLKHFHYRSSWELLLMQSLDNDVSVLSWEYEFVSIPYELDGIKRRYVPDFHVIYENGLHVLLEVKPQALRDIKRNIVKRQAAIDFCEKNGWEYREWAPNNEV